MRVLIIGLLLAASLSSVGQVNFTCSKIEMKSEGQEIQRINARATVTFKDTVLITVLNGEKHTIRLIASTAKSDTLSNGTIHISWTGITEHGTITIVGFLYDPGYEILTVGPSENDSAVVTFHLKKVDD